MFLLFFHVSCHCFIVFDMVKFIVYVDVNVIRFIVFVVDMVKFNVFDVFMV